MICGFVLANLKVKECRRKEGVWALKLLDFDNLKCELETVKS